MNLAQLLDRLKRDERFLRNVTRWEVLPPVAGEYADYPPDLDPRLVDVMRRRGARDLYVHQAEACRLAAARRPFVVVTPTASGKTLCYNLPVLDAVLRDPQARALYLFPTKALSQDQLAEVHGIVTDLGADIRTCTFDGDTPETARRAIRNSGHIVITNPDMLHQGILPHHTLWVKLFENLRYVVVDEVHQYRGVFGSHVANVLRRLRRVATFYGADPLFIGCSATVANPGELAGALAGRPVEVIERNGAPRGEKHFIFYNPPVVNRELGIRRSAVKETRAIAERFLAADAQTIVFARSRIRVELLLTYLERAGRRVGTRGGEVRGYRGGYLPSERRSIEQGLRDGTVRAVVSTNALELGIDIGRLDVCVMCGYAGTVAATWQQAGRAGRRQGLSCAVLVATSAPGRPVHRAPPGVVLRPLAGVRHARPRQPGGSRQPPQVRRVRAAVPRRRGFRRRAGDGDPRLSRAAGGAAPGRRSLPLDGRHLPGGGCQPAQRCAGERGDHRSQRGGRAGDRRDGPVQRPGDAARRGHLHPRRAAVPRGPARLGTAGGVRASGAGGLLHRRPAQDRTEDARLRGANRGAARIPRAGRDRPGLEGDGVQEDQARDAREYRCRARPPAGDGDAHHRLLVGVARDDAGRTRRRTGSISATRCRVWPTCSVTWRRCS